MIPKLILLEVKIEQSTEWDFIARYTKMIY
jgi:hypothetical protein